MNKKGFTLAELMGVVTVLAIISLIVFPPLIKQIKDTKNNLDSATEKFILTAADNHIYENKDNYPKIDQEIYCIPLEQLVSEGKLPDSLKDSDGNEIMDKYVKVNIRNNKYNYEIVDKCTRRYTLVAEPNYGTITNYNGWEEKNGKISKTQEVDTKIGSLPTINKLGNVFLGWYDTLNGGTEYTSDITITIAGEHNIYANFRTSKVSIKYSANDGTIDSQTTDSDGTVNNWSTVDNIVYKNNVEYLTNINYGSSLSNSGLVNYNNSTFINITKENYAVAPGKEWICLSGCSAPNKIFSQSTVYSHTDFCDISYNDCIVELGVNWANLYTIVYDANTGTNAPSSQSKIHGVDLTLSSDKPTKTGHTFQGWNTNKNATEKQYNAGDTFTTDANTTLYAIWNINTYTISFDANGGTGVPDAQVKTYGVDLTLPSKAPTRSGYIFLGWSADKNATTADYLAGGTFTTDAHTKLYAVWKENTFTITYDANGGTGAPSAQTKTYGVDLTLSSTVPTRTNYKFLGWSTNISATTADYLAGGTFKVDANTTLYAVWEFSDVTPPTCKLTVTSGSTTVTANPSDNVGLAYYGWSSSYSGANSTSTTISSAGTLTYYVKDTSGNLGSCSASVVSTYSYQCGCTTNTYQSSSQMSGCSCNYNGSGLYTCSCTTCSTCRDCTTAQYNSGYKFINNSYCAKAN